MFEIYLTMLITAIALSIIGTFLVLRNLSMTADGISHSVLLGIVVGFLISRDLNSPILIIGAVLAGLLTVILVELLLKSGRINEDSALGIVFPLLFSLGVIIMSSFLKNTHLCVDGVLMGEILMSKFNRTVFLGIDMPFALKMAIIVLTVNLLFIMVFFKELKVTAFDTGFAIISGFSAAFIHYMTMTLVSLNSVIAFNSVGSILVISFMVAPAASAILLTKDLRDSILLTILISFINVSLGVFAGYRLNINIAGTTALIGMLTYIICHIIKPGGLLTKLLNRKKQLDYLNEVLVLIHIQNHMGQANQNIELGVNTIQDHLKMNLNTMNETINRLMDRNIIQAGEFYSLTDKGMEYFREIEKRNGI